MADRTVSVKLIADARQYIEGMDAAARKTRESTQTIEQKLGQQREAFTQVGAAAMTIGALAAAGVTAAVVAFANFDQAMSNVQAATHESAQNMELLRDAALEAGARTVFSATESAAAIEELAKAGISTADILGGGLNGALDLAAAGGIAVADAAELAASAMTQFALDGGDAVHVADLLAAGAGKAQGGVAEMGDALNQSGLVAAQMGLSIEETVGSLTAFASAGLIGSDAGTSFRSMLLRLANPTNESAGLMDELGLSFYNAQGDFIGMEGVAGQLQSKLADLTTEQRNAALAQIFGQDAIRTSAILYEQGAEGVADWTAAVDDSGYAAETAATRLDNLKGDFEQLTGALETALIGIGESGDGPLRLIVQTFAELVTGFTELPGPVQQSVGLLGGAVAVIGLVGGAAMVALPQVVAFRGALQTLGITAATTRTALAGIGGVLGPAGLVAAGFYGLAQWLESTRPQAEEWAEAIRDGATATDMLTLANQGFINTIDGFEFDPENVANYVDQLNRIDESGGWASLLPENWDVQFSDFANRLEQIDANLSQMDVETARAGFDDLVETLGLNAYEADQLLLQMPQLADVLEDSEDAASGAAEGMEAVASATEIAAEAAGGLYDETKALNDLFFGAQDAMSAYEQSIDDIAEAMTGDDALVPALLEGGEGFNLAEQAGRDAAGMLQELVGNAQSASEALSANGATAEELASQQDAAREQIYNTGIQMGLSEDAARSYADRLVEIPEEVSTQVALDTAAATRAISAFVNQRRVATIEVAAGPMPSIIARNGVATAYAAGGRIPGYAPGYDDRLGFLNNGSVVGLGGGEYIMPTRMTDKYLHILEQMRTGSFVGYASGGRVASPQQSSSYRPVINVSAPSSGGGVTVQQTIQPVQGMSEQVVADKSVAAISYAFRGL